MKLELNKNHIKAKTNIDSKKLEKFVISSLLTVSLLSGCFCNVKAFDVSNEISSDMKEQIDYYIYEKGTYTSEILLNLKNLSLSIEENSDMSWLNYCSNLEELFLTFRNDVNIQKCFGNLNNLNSLEKISLYSFKKYDEFNENNFSFLKNCSNLKELSINSFYVDKSFIESFTNIEKIRIGHNITNFNIDFDKFTNLKEIEFFEIDEYDLAIYLDDYTIKRLYDRGIVINTNGINIEDVININKDINQIISNLDINSSSTDIEKLNAILYFVLDSLKYDTTVNNNNLNGITDTNLISRFYNGGFLFGALNGDTAICGNYSALFQALAIRLGLESYFLINDFHAWNLVNINEEYYYVDTTFLDGISIDIDNDGLIDLSQNIIKEGNGSSLEWYLADPTKKSDLTHTSYNIPLHIEIKPITNNKDYSSNDLYSININDNKYIVTLYMLIGILGIFGVSKLVSNKKKNNTKILK